MESSKLIAFLSVLKKTEMQALEQHIKSLFYHKTDGTWAFFLFVKKELEKEPTLQVLQKESIFKHLYPKKTYNDLKMRKLMHTLYQQLERFILEQEKTNRFEKEIHLLHFCRKHYLKKERSEILAILNEKIARCEQQDIAYWEAKIQAETFKGYEIASQYIYKSEMNIPNIIQVQTVHFFITQLKWHFCAYANGGHSVQSEPSAFFTTILAEIEQHHKWLEIPLLKVYYYANMLFLKPDDFHYFEYLRDFVTQENAFISLTEKTELAVTIRNYLANKINFDDEYILAYYELLLSHLPFGYCFSNNHLTPQSFRNIVSLGCRLGRIAEIKQFIADYHSFLPEDGKENMLLFAKAHLFFAEKEYTQSLKLLSILEKFQFLGFEFNIRLLKIRNLYHLQDFEACLQQIHAFKAFIRRNNVSDNKETRYLNFARFLSLLCQLSPEEKEKRQLLAEEIKQCSLLVYKEWLLSVSYS